MIKLKRICISTGGYTGSLGVAKQLNELQVVWIQRLRKLHAKELCNSCSSLVFVDSLHEKADEDFFIIWDITPCIPFKSTDVSEDHVASIFRVKE
jgi:hypothetical protein